MLNSSRDFVEQVPQIHGYLTVTDSPPTRTCSARSWPTSPARDGRVSSIDCVARAKATPTQQDWR